MGNSGSDSSRTGISDWSRKGERERKRKHSDGYDVGGQEVTRQRMNKGTGAGEVVLLWEREGTAECTLLPGDFLGKWVATGWSEQKLPQS